MEKLDYDLTACLEYNQQKEFNVSDIVRVLAVVEGEHDGGDWFWVLKLKGSRRFAVLQGWCDHTGWDCQSSACSVITKTALDACKATGRYQEKTAGIQSALEKQVKAGKKSLTWQEQKDDEFKEFPRRS